MYETCFLKLQKPVQEPSKSTEILSASRVAIAKKVVPNINFRKFLTDFFNNLQYKRVTVMYFFFCRHIIYFKHPSFLKNTLQFYTFFTVYLSEDLKYLLQFNAYLCVSCFLKSNAICLPLSLLLFCSPRNTIKSDIFNLMKLY